METVLEIIVACIEKRREEERRGEPPHYEHFDLIVTIHFTCPLWPDLAGTEPRIWQNNRAASGVMVRAVLWTPETLPTNLPIPI